MTLYLIFRVRSRTDVGDGSFQGGANVPHLSRRARTNGSEISFCSWRRRRRVARVRAANVKRRRRRRWTNILRYLFIHVTGHLPPRGICPTHISLPLPKKTTSHGRIIVCLPVTIRAESYMVRIRVITVRARIITVIEVTVRGLGFWGSC